MPNDNANDDLVEQILQNAKRRGLGPVEWARLSKLNRRTIASVQNGSHKNPGLTTITKMGRGLGLELVWQPTKK